MRDTLICEAKRTAGGKFGGSLKNLSAVELGSHVIKQLVNELGIKNEVDQIIFGNAWQAGVGPNPARLATVKAGLPNTVPAFTVNIRCGSSLRALQLAALSISAGESDLVIAGGMESASNVPYLLLDARWGYRMGSNVIKDALHKDGFICPLAEMFMGDTAEIVNEKYGITRAEQDKYALQSQIKAKRAIESGRFNNEIIPIPIQEKTGKKIFEKDEVNRETTIEKLSRLKAVFNKGNTVTAGNSSALCDAASVVIAASAEKAEELGLRPKAKILAYSYIALDPVMMGLGPVKAMSQALEKANLKIQDIDLIEINEAFAGQVLACINDLNINPNIVNVRGGAIALGHPIAATGTKLLATLINSLIDEDKEIGAVTLCIGGGQGVAMIVQRI